MSGEELGNSVDEVDELLKKHETFEKLLTTQEEKVITMVELAEQLKADKHLASEDINEKQQSVINRYIVIYVCVHMYVCTYSRTSIIRIPIIRILSYPNAILNFKIPRDSFFAKPSNK